MNDEWDWLKRRLGNRRVYLTGMPESTASP